MDIKDWFPEFKVSAESDVDLHKYFLETPQFESIINGSKWLILGRKGTGKTAIHEYIRAGTPDKLNGYHPLTLNFKDYPWPIHKLYKESMEGEMTAYQKSWHYLFIVQALSRLIQLKEELGEDLSDSLKKAKGIINKIYGRPFPSLVEVIKSKIARIDSLSLPNLDANGLTFSAGEISFEGISVDTVLKQKLRTNAFTLLNYFEQLLVQNSGGIKLLICLDQLDENWLADEIEEYSKILVNLIHVCQDFNNSQKYRNLLKLLVFLRTDIYETLRFNDKNKIYQDSAIEIRWDASSLEDMLFERIKIYKPENHVFSLEGKGNSIFEIKNVRHGATPIRHILRRTFYRPRDIIVYFNKTRELHSTSRDGLYTSRDLYGAEKNYSLSLYSELIDEWSNQKPEIEKYLRVLQNIGVQSFSLSDFASKYNAVFQSDDRASINEAIQFLFINSIIGQKISVNWEYFCRKPHMQIDLEKQFHVNSGLKDRLMLTESRRHRKKRQSSQARGRS